MRNLCSTYLNNTINMTPASTKNTLLLPISRGLFAANHASHPASVAIGGIPNPVQNENKYGCASSLNFVITLPYTKANFDYPSDVKCVCVRLCVYLCVCVCARARACTCVCVCGGGFVCGKGRMGVCSVHGT